MKKKQTRKVRPSKLDRVTENTAHVYSQASTDDIQRMHIVLACKANVVNDKNASLRFEVAAARARRADIEAQLRGLAVVVGKR